MPTIPHILVLPIRAYELEVVLPIHDCGSGTLETVRTTAFLCCRRQSTLAIVVRLLNKSVQNARSFAVSTQFFNEMRSYKAIADSYNHTCSLNNINDLCQTISSDNSAHVSFYRPLVTLDLGWSGLDPSGNRRS